MLRCWWLVATAWVAALTALLLWAPNMESVRTKDDASLLPPNVPSRQAIEAIQADFDKPPPLSIAAVVFERHRQPDQTGQPDQPDRPGPSDPSPTTAASATAADALPTAGLNAGDWDYITRLTRELQRLAAANGWEVFSPTDPKQFYLRGTLIGPQGEAAIIKIDIPANFVSQKAIDDVALIRQTARQLNPPDGLTWAITGSASYGYDYFQATQTSLDRTTWVTVLAVVIVLLLTYRALLAAAISLVTVSVAVVVSVSLVAIGGALGWSVSMIVELFAIVIGYGAGVDFSLFFLSRYQEELGREGRGDRASRRQSIVRALAGTGPAIVASAGTVAAGLGLMHFARFPVFRTAGPAVAVSVVVSCLASLTLTPVLAYLTGRATFWPRRPELARERSFWDRLAGFTVRRPVLILLAGLALLTPPAIHGFNQEALYDSLADLPPDEPSVRGAHLFAEHFPTGEMAPIHVLVRFDQPLTVEQWAQVARTVDAELEKPGQFRFEIQRVRSLLDPLGAGKLTFDNRLARLLPQFRDEVVPRYLGGKADGQAGYRAARWEIAIGMSPHSNRAMDSLSLIRATIRTAAANVLDTRAQPQVLLAGDTAEMYDLREVTDGDFWRVSLLVVAAILLIVFALIRDLPAAVFVMAATILTYGAALGATSWIFAQIYGTTGPDWKVEFFLFVILIAVGQDYNLFMLTRIREERRLQPLRPATESAVARTGAIISCCGLIMAATLGSLASSPLRLLEQLGVAFVIGLLLDTFLVRPLMVPAFVLRFRRMDNGPDQPQPAVGRRKQGSGNSPQLQSVERRVLP